MTHIEFSNGFEEKAEHIIDGLSDLQENERDYIERVKEEKGVDNLLCEQFQQVKQNSPGMARNGHIDEAAIMGEIAHKIDLAIAILAHCKNPEEITKVVQQAVLLGRRNGKKVDKEKVGQVLRKTFFDIDLKYQHHIAGTNDKSMPRRKMKAALMIINESFSHKKSTL